MNMNKKAVVSFSGGMDSTCLVLKLLAEGYEVRAYNFDYGQQHNIELKLAKKNVKYLQQHGLPVTIQTINMRDIFSDSQSCLVRHTGAPEGDYRSESMRETVVENRNVIFSAVIYGKALAWANQIHDKVLISLGVHAGDHSVYPDCTEESVNMAKELYRISNWGSDNVEYYTPFVNIEKYKVLAEGLAAMYALGFTKAQRKHVLRNTNSCYKPDEKGMSCGRCGTCNERIEAFAKNGLKDPVKYSVAVDWNAEFAKYR